MPIVIKQARTSQQLVDILEHRHHCVYATNGRIVDHLDVLPTTTNIVAYLDGAIVGSCRVTLFERGKPKLWKDFDFSEASSKLEGLLGFIDMTSISVSANLFATLFQYLYKMGTFQLLQKGYQHVFGFCDPEDFSTLEALGFRSLVSEPSDFVPVALDIKEFSQRFESVFADREILRFQEVFYFSIFQPGEVMVVEGERGNTAYVAERGEVEVVIRSEQGLLSISQIPTGQLIGEVAMITNEPRTASLISKGTTACVSFDRSDFLRIMYAEPHRSIEIFRILSRRLSASNKRIAELGKV